MLFRDKTEDIIRDSLYVARNNANEARKKQVEEAADYADGNQLGYIVANLGENPDHFAARPKIAFPFTDLLLRELSLMYKRPPARYFGEEGSEQQRYADDLMTLWEDEGEPVNPSLLALDKRTRLHGDMAVEVVPDKRTGAPRWNYFSPDQIDVFQDPRRPNRATGVLLCVGMADTVSKRGAEYRAWTEEKTWRIVDGRTEEIEDNPLRRIPVVFFKNTVEHQRFWSPGYDTKIVPQNRAFDQRWCDLLWLMVTQCHSILVGKDVDPKLRKSILEEGLGFHPGTLALVSKDGSIESVTPEPRIEPMIAALEKMIERTYWICGLPASKFNADAVAESGAAYRAKNASVLEDREARITLFKPRERALWRLTFDVAELYHDGPSAPESIVIDYAEPEAPEATSEKQAALEWQLKSHLVSVVDLMIEENPDLDEAGALAQLQKNKALNDAVFAKKASKGSSVAEFLRSVGIGKGASKDESDEDESEGENMPADMPEGMK